MTTNNVSIGSVKADLENCNDLHDFQVEAILEYVKRRHPGYLGIAKSMIVRYKASTAPQRVALVSAIKRFFPPSVK